MQPFMPQKMQTALNMLGVDPARRTWDQRELGCDFEYGTSMVPLPKKSVEGALFPPIVTDDF